MPRGHTHVLGLDIGKSTIKAVELRRTGSGVELLGQPMVVPTPENGVEGGVIVDADAITSALADLVATAGFKTKKAIAAVGGDTSVVVRITEVPNMTGKELKEAIEWELERQTPFPIEQTIYDYKPLDPPDADPNAQNMEVLIAVAQEDMIDSHVDSIQGAKLVPVGVDVEPLAIARSLVDAAGDALADQTVGVVHMGASLTLILVIRKGLLSFVRSVPTAGETLTQAIQQNFMGDEKLSEQVKRQFADLSEALYEGGTAAPAQDAGAHADDVLGGDEDADSVFELSDPATAALPSEQPVGDEGGVTQLDVAEPAAGDLPPRPAEAPAAPDMNDDEAAARQIVYEAVAPAVVDLATEIRRSIDFYRRQHRNEEVDRMILSGGSAGIHGLAEFIAAESGIRTELADPFAHLEVDEDIAPRQYLADIGPGMVVAVGLALRDMIED